MSGRAGADGDARRELAIVVLLLAGWAALFVLVDPRGAFPLNDDFQYANSARRLLSTGELRLSPWSVSPNVPHIALGAAGGFFLGADNWGLRLLNLALGGAAAAAFFLFLRREGSSPAVAALTAAALAADPIYAAMSASFHAEITTFVLQLAAAAALLRGLRRRSAAWLAAASLALAACALNRPTNAAGLLGAAWLLRRENALDRRAGAALLAPAAAALAAFAAWFAFGHGPTWAWQTKVPSLPLAALLEPRSWLAIPLRANAALQTLSLLLLPLALAAAPQSALRPLGARERWALPAIAALALLGAAHGGMPLMGNTISRLGLGAGGLEFSALKQAGIWGAPGLWRAADAAALLSSLVLARTAFAAELPLAARAGLWLFLPAYLAIALNPVPQIDRYLLIPLPWLAAALALRLRPGRLGLTLGAAGCALLLAASASGLRDYFSWNRARWAAGQKALALGVAREHLKAGFDWDGQDLLERNFERLLATRPPRAVGDWDWWRLDPVRMFVSFGPVPGFPVVERFPYASPFLRGPGYVYLHEFRRAPAAAASNARK